MDIIGHPKHPAASVHKVALKIYSGNCSLHGLLQAIKYNISSTSWRETEEEMVLLGMQEGIPQFPAAA